MIWQLKKKIPRYCVFHNATIDEIAKVKPKTASEFLKIKGLGPQKLQSYGEPILNYFNNSK